MFPLTRTTHRRTSHPTLPLRPMALHRFHLHPIRVLLHTLLDRLQLPSQNLAKNYPCSSFCSWLAALSSSFAPGLDSDG